MESRRKSEHTGKQAAESTSKRCRAQREYLRDEDRVRVACQEAVKRRSVSKSALRGHVAPPQRAAARVGDGGAEHKRDAGVNILLDGHTALEARVAAPARCDAARQRDEAVDVVAQRSAALRARSAARERSAAAQQADERVHVDAQRVAALGSREQARLGSATAQEADERVHVPAQNHNADATYRGARGCASAAHQREAGLDVRLQRDAAGHQPVVLALELQLGLTVQK